MKKRILIVEDQFVIAYDLKQILEEEAFEIFFNVPSVEAALEVLDSVSIDLVLLDIGLKGEKTGLDLAHHLNHVYKIPFIFITSYHDLKTLQDVHNTHPAGYLVKPFKALDVTTAVQMVFLPKEMKIQADAAVEDLFDESDVPYRIKKVLQYIDAHVREKIEIDTLAQLSGWHKQYFIRVFQRATKLTPYQYILNQKVEKAAVMITTTESTFSNIAFEYGFLSYGNFNRAFKKVKGVTPERYRMRFR